MPTTIASIEILVVNHVIQFKENGAPSNGNIHGHHNQANQEADFESDNPFAIFFKASARMLIKPPRRPYNIAITVNPPSPDDSGNAVVCSEFKQGMWRVKLKLKGNIPRGTIYWYGVAAFDPPFNIATIDPQIIIN